MFMISFLSFLSLSLSRSFLTMYPGVFLLTPNTHLKYLFCSLSIFSLLLPPYFHFITYYWPNLSKNYIFFQSVFYFYFLIFYICPSIAASLFVLSFIRASCVPFCLTTSPKYFISSASSIILPFYICLIFSLSPFPLLIWFCSYLSPVSFFLNTPLMSSSTFLFFPHSWPSYRTTSAYASVYTFVGPILPFFTSFSKFANKKHKQTRT